MEVEDSEEQVISKGVESSIEVGSDNIDKVKPMSSGHQSAGNLHNVVKLNEGSEHGVDLDHLPQNLDSSATVIV